MAKQHHDDLDPEVERVVDDLLKADKIIERFRERCKALEIDCEFDPPGLMDRLMLVHTTLLGKTTGAVTQGVPSDEIFKRLEALRAGLSEELKAYVDQLASGHRGYSVWTEAEEAKVNETFVDVGLPPMKDILKMKPDEVCKMIRERTTPPSMQVKLEAKEKIHADFQDVLFRKNVDERYAKRTLDLLLNTNEGNEMLKLMVYDSVMIQRKRAAAKAPPG
jgi:hypothetical protein